MASPTAFMKNSHMAKAHKQITARMNQVVLFRYKIMTTSPVQLALEINK
jgi:hypothetical protein